MASRSVHPAQVAGAFYPEQPDALRAAVAAAVQRSAPPCIDPKVAVIPHAGLSFSSHVAASAIAPWARRAGVKKIVIIGPAHHYSFEGVVTHPAQEWETPLGRVRVAATRKLANVKTLSAAFKREHAIELPLVMLQAMMPEPFEIVPLLVGKANVAQVAAVLRQAWGGPETLIAISSDLSHYHDLAKATALDRATAAKIETLNASITAVDACGYRPLAAVLQLAAEWDLRPTTLHLSTSAETSGDASKVVGYGAFGFEYAASARIGDADRAMLLHAAKAWLAKAVELGGKQPELKLEGALTPALATRRATFVTLKRGGRLRGCVGQSHPTRPLLGDVLVNALKAGFSDPRFGPLTREELPELEVSISILSHPRRVAVSGEEELANRLDPDRDGLILGDQGKAALFLPAVWESVREPKAFIRHLKTKAGHDADHWSSSISARKFTAETFGASWNSIQ